MNIINMSFYERFRELANNDETCDKSMIVIADYDRRKFFSYSFKEVFARVCELEFSKNKIKYLNNCKVNIDDYIFVIRCIIENQNLAISNSLFLDEDIKNISLKLKDEGYFYLFSSGTTNRKVIELNYDDLLKTTYQNYTKDSSIGTFWSSTSLSAISGITSSICYPIITGNTSISVDASEIIKYTSLDRFIDFFKVNTITVGNGFLVESTFLKVDNCESLKKINFAGSFFTLAEMNMIKKVFGEKITLGLVYGQTESYGRMTYMEENNFVPMYIDLSKIKCSELNLYTNEYVVENISTMYSHFNLIEIINCGYLSNDNIKISERISIRTKINDTEFDMPFGYIYCNGRKTGDYGFILNNRLYVLGRTKNMIRIINEKKEVTGILHMDLIQSFFIDKMGMFLHLYLEENKIKVKACSGCYAKILKSKSGKTKYKKNDIRKIMEVKEKTYEFIKHIEWLNNIRIEFEYGNVYLTKELGKYISPEALINMNRILESANKYEAINGELVEKKEKNKRR